MKTTIKLFKHWHKEFKSYYPKRTQYEKPMQFAEGFKNDVITKYLPNYLSNEYSKDMNYWIEEKQQLDTHKLIISSKNLKVIEHIKEILEWFSKALHSTHTCLFSRMLLMAYVLEKSQMMR